jgi:hypothetical protein
VPPATSRSARPARISSGIGTELALSVSVGAPASVSVGGSFGPSTGGVLVVSVVSVLSGSSGVVDGFSPGVGSVRAGGAASPRFAAWRARWMSSFALE